MSDEIEEERRKRVRVMWFRWFGTAPPETPEEVSAWCLWAHEHGVQMPPEWGERLDTAKRVSNFTLMPEPEPRYRYVDPTSFLTAERAVEWESETGLLNRRKRQMTTGVHATEEAAFRAVFFGGGFQ